MCPPSLVGVQNKCLITVTVKIFTDCISKGGTTIISFHLYVCLFLLYLLNQLIYSFDLLHVNGSLPWLTGDWNWRSQVKVRVRVKMQSVWPRSSIEDSFLVYYLLTSDFLRWHTGSFWRGRLRLWFVARWRWHFETFSFHLRHTFRLVFIQLKMETNNHNHPSSPLF